MRKALFSSINSKNVTNFSPLCSKRTGDYVYRISKAEGDSIYKVSTYSDSCSFSLNDRLLREEYMSEDKIMKDPVLSTLIRGDKCPNKEYPLL